MKQKELQIIKTEAATLHHDARKAENKLNVMNRRGVNEVMAEQNNQDIVIQSQQLKQLKNEVNENTRIIHQ